MYLSILCFDINKKHVVDELHDRYNLHRTLSRGLPDYSAERILWRLELEQHTARIIVQTKLEPNWNDPEIAKKLARDPIVRNYALNFREGQDISFIVECNPTKKTKAGRRLGLENIAERHNWLERQYQKMGLKTTVVNSGMQKMHIRKNKSVITILAVRFEGNAQIVEPTKLIQGVTAGIGRAKGFGMGMISLA